MTSYPDDEALAQALQAEYSRQFRQSHRQPPPTAVPQQPPPRMMPSFRPPPTAPPSAPPEVSVMTEQQISSTEESDAAMARRLQEQFRAEDGGRNSSPSRRSSPPRSNNRRGGRRPAPVAPSPTIAVSDEEFARNLERQMNEEDRVWRSRNNNSGANFNSGNPAHCAPSRSTSMTSGMTDEELAFRIEQEMRDEDMARNLERQQRGAADARAAADAAARQRARRCSCQRVLSYVIPVAVLAGAAVALIYWLGGPSNIPDIFIPSPEDFRNEDPFDAQNASDASKWRSRGEGLELEVWNSLSERWQEFFYRSVIDWDEGTPDALTLTTLRQQPETICLPVEGVMKVCNDDYGATRWRGLNEVLISTGFNQYIVASTAKMNEHYFRGDGNVQEQYTMCHEMGHGFGLPHTDENFFNSDLGNCMDYTNNPEANMQPDEMNFKFLAELYGVIPGSSYNTTTGNRRTQEVASSRRPLPEWLLNSWQDAVARLENGLDGKEHEEGWRVLHRTTHGVAHERNLGTDDFGNGYAIRVHMLLATDPE